MDSLIRELVRTGREATSEEVARIVERIAMAPFEPRRVGVRPKDQGREYLGRQLGAREGSLFYHLVKRVLFEKQWAYGTTEDEYLGDLRRAVRHQSARIAVYKRWGGIIAAVLSTTDVIPGIRRGELQLAYLLIVYSADRGIIVSGYQISNIGAASIPEDALWLK